MGLTYEEMINLFKLKENKIKALKSLKNTTDAKEIKQLNEIVLLGEKATIELIETNLPLVDFIISTRYSNIKMDYDDLLQEGTLGLIHAISRFDYKLGYKLSTFAQYWIRSYINQAINNNLNLGISSYSLARLGKVNKYETEYILLNGRSPSYLEISKNTDLSVETIKELKNLPTIILLETPICNIDDELTLMDIIEDVNIKTPSKEYELNIIKKELQEAISTLSDVEQKVIKFRYGFANNIYTLKQTSEKINLSIERTRQIQLEALEKLKIYYKNNLRD